MICLLACFVVTLRLTAQNPLSEPLADIPPTDDPDGISPTHVYAKAELLNRSLDRLIESWNEQKLGATIVRSPELPHEVEKDLQPMHVYQTMLTCTWRLQQLDDHDDLNVRHIPTMSSQPREYRPRDVFFLVTMMLENVQQIAKKLKIEDMPSEQKPESDKTATDVYFQAVKAFMKLNALNEHETIEASEVYSQMVRAAEDARSILRQYDPACRYRIDRIENTEERKPADVFGKCLEIRQLIKQHFEFLKDRLDETQAKELKVTPIPDMPTQTINPRDVFFQTQIIIAELNLLKMALGTKSSTPLAIEVGDETKPTHVYQQGLLVEYLVRQIQSGANLPLTPAVESE